MVKRSQVRWFSLVGVLVAIGMVVAACGGGTPTATPRPAATATAAPTATTAAAATPIPTATVVPATSTPAGPQPRYGGTLKSRDVFDWPNWDSYHSSGAFANHNAMNIVSNLIVFKKGNAGLIEPDLAERWEFSEDGLTLTFSLLNDVQWHDGTPVVADQIVWNLNRAWKGEPPIVFSKNRFTTVTDITAPDSRTVKVSFSRPTVSFLPYLAGPFMLMYSPQGPDPSTTEFKKSGIGSGPFMIEAYAPNIKYTWVRNPNYYKKDAAGRQLPYLDGVEVFVLSGPTLSIAAFRTGQIDCGCSYDNDYLTPKHKALEAEIPGVKLTSVSNDRFALYINSRPPWDRKDVRKAFVTGLDLRTINQVWRDGAGHYPPNYSIRASAGGQWGLSDEELLKVPGLRLGPDGDKDPRDTELAKELWQETGIDPTELTITFSGGTFWATFEELVISIITASTGVKVDMAKEPTGTSTERRIAGNFDMSTTGGGQTLDDPSAYLARWYPSFGSQNYGKYNIPEIDRLTTEVDSELDPVRRLDLFQQLQRKLLDEAYVWPLQSIPTTVGTREWVFGFVPGVFAVSSSNRFDTLWLAEGR